jgi:hypothetical protein
MDNKQLDKKAITAALTGIIWDYNSSFRDNPLKSADIQQ